MNDKKKLKISIIIPAYNEEELLPNCLEALMPQARKLGAEVIVVDNNSTDRTSQIALSFNAVVINEPKQGYAHTLEKGIESSHNEIMAVTDADTIVSPDWLETICQAFLNQKIVATTGPVKFPGRPFLSILHWLTPHDLCGANMAFRRTAYETCRDIDRNKVNFGFDLVLGKKLQKLGKIAFFRNQSVETSSRRFNQQLFWQSVIIIINYFSILLFNKPCFWNFLAIRTPSRKLEQIRKRKQIISVASFAFLLLIYLMAWPHSTVFGQIMVRPKIKAKMIALTFDDGPNGASTRQIVEILKKYSVPATFFEVGRSILADPETSKFVAQNGFSIENHSWDHSFFIPVLNTKKIEHEINQTNSIIKEATGREPDFFRPPHGWRSPQLIIEAKEAHLKIVDWSIDPEDYLTDNPKLIEKRVIDHIKPGSIILLHDGLQDGPRVKALHNRQGTIKALPTIIETLKDKGYVFVKLDQLISELAQEKKAKTKI